LFDSETALTQLVLASTGCTSSLSINDGPGFGSVMHDEPILGGGHTSKKTFSFRVFFLGISSSELLEEFTSSELEGTYRSFSESNELKSVLLCDSNSSKIKLTYSNTFVPLATYRLLILSP
jgi:hypothetical protein